MGGGGRRLRGDGGLFAGGYAVVGGVHEVVPVDLHIRGCPPAPPSYCGACWLCSSRAKERSFAILDALTVSSLQKQNPYAVPYREDTAYGPGRRKRVYARLRRAMGREDTPSMGEAAGAKSLEHVSFALMHSLFVVMPGLVPGTHVFRATKQNVGGRDKPGP